MEKTSLTPGMSQDELLNAYGTIIAAMGREIDTSSNDYPSAPLLWIRYLPTVDVVDAAIEFIPAARDLIVWWAEAMARIDASLAKPLTDLGNGPMAGYHRIRVRRAVEAAEGRTTDEDDRVALRARVVVLQHEASLLSGGMRDWRHAVVEDANAIQAIALHGSPNEIAFYFKDRCLCFVGNDEEGYPRFVPIETISEKDEAWFRASMRRANEATVPYWTYPAFQAAAGRLIEHVPTRSVLSVRLAELALQGWRKAFVKAAPFKQGTWVVDLEGVANPFDAWGRVCSVVGPEFHFPDEGMLIQEHLPFRFEQRFYVVDGRIVGSVSSDRTSSHLDTDNGARLDPHVAAIVKPSFEVGPYGRGHTVRQEDRLMSARFARRARSIVAALASEEILDYSLDMGFCENGILPIELNDLVRSGPYGLDRSRIVRAYTRAYRRIPEISTLLVEAMRSVSPEPTLPSRASIRRFHEVDMKEPGIASALAMLPGCMPIGRLRIAVGLEEVQASLIVVVSEGRLMVLCQHYEAGASRTSIVPIGADRTVVLDDPISASVDIVLESIVQPSGTERYVVGDNGRVRTTLDLERDARGTTVVIETRRNDVVVGRCSRRIRGRLDMLVSGHFGKDGKLVDPVVRKSSTADGWAAVAGEARRMTFSFGRSGSTWTATTPEPALLEPIGPEAGTEPVDAEN